MIDGDLVDQVLEMWYRSISRSDTLTEKQRAHTLTCLRKIQKTWHLGTEGAFQSNMNQAFSRVWHSLSYIQQQYIKTCGSWIRVITLSYEFGSDDQLQARNTIAAGLFCDTSTHS